MSVKIYSRNITHAWLVLKNSVCKHERTVSFEIDHESTSFDLLLEIQHMERERNKSSGRKSRRDERDQVENHGTRFLYKGNLKLLSERISFC